MILVPLLVLLALRAAPSPDEPLDPPAAKLAEGREAWTRGDLGTALELLRAAVGEAPGEPAIRLDLARVLNDLGRGEEALDALAPAMDAAPGSAWTLVELGRARRLAGDDDAAAAAFRQALEKHPRCGPARLFLSDLLVEAGRTDDARAVLEPLVARAPRDPAVAVARARVAASAGKDDEAAAILRACLDSHPQSREAREALCRRLLESGHAQEAWDAGEPLLDAPRGPATMRLLARVAEEANRPLDALALLGAALVDDPTHAGALADLGEILEHRSDLRRRIARRGIEARPGDVEGWRELLETFLDGEDLAGFFTTLEEAPAGVRGAPRLRLMEGEALRRANRGEEARAVLEPLCQSVPGGGAAPAGEASRAWYELGLLAHAEGRFEEAEHAFARAAGAETGGEKSVPAPWAADAWFNRGMCLVRLDRHADAARSLEAAIQLRPDFREAWLQLATCRRFRLGDRDGARKAYARWIALGGDDPEIRRYVEEDQP